MRSFWCFISYRHADNKELGRQWATWLHQAIETYEVPADLVGKPNERGETIPERIFPVFRDEEELPVDADLASPIYRALDDSKFLLVICSPRAVESAYVANEIRYYKKLGREDHVLAAMIDGEPNASWDAGKQAHGFGPTAECFPEPLRHRVDAEGQLLEERTEPVAADFRLDDGTQGWTSPEAYRHALLAAGQVAPKEANEWVEAYRKKCELMKLKIISGLLGVSLGTLTKRDAAYQLALAQKRAKTLRRWLAAVGLLTLLAVAGGIIAAVQWQTAVAETNRATLAQQEAQQQQARAEAGEKAAQAARDQALAAQKDADAQRKVAESEKTDAEQQRTRAEEGEKQAKLETDKAVAAKKDAVDLIHYMQYDLDDMLGKLGQLQMMGGINQKIRDFYDKHPEDAGDDASLREKAVALNQEGDLEQSQGEIDKALDAFNEACLIRRELVAKAPANSLWQHDLYVSLVSIGGIQQQTNHLDDAVKSYREALAITQALAQKEPANDNWQDALAASYAYVGGVLKDQAKLPEALAAYQASRAIRETLAQKMPADNGRQNELAQSLLDSSRILDLAGNLPEALKAAQEAVAICEMLTEKDSNNMDWKYNLATSQLQVGDVFADQLQLLPALAAYEKAVVSLRSLCQLDKVNARWRTSLTTGIKDLGNMYQGQNRFEDALKSYQEALAIDQSLLQAAPNEAPCKNNVSRDHEAIGNLLHEEKKTAPALDEYRQALAIDEDLVKAAPDNVQWESNLCGSLINLAVVLEAQSVNEKQNHWDEVLKSYQQIQGIRQHLAQVYPDNVVRQDDYAWTYLGIGNLLLENPNGNRKEAAKVLSQGLGILDAQMKKSQPPSEREKNLRRVFVQLQQQAA